MAAGSSPHLQCLLALIILFLQWPEGTVTLQAVPLPRLFANAISRADHLLTLAAQTYTSFDRTYVSDNQRNSMQPVNCFSQGIHEPVGKVEVQQMSDAELLKISLAFIRSWFSAMRSFKSQDDVYSSFTRVPIYEKLTDLAEGIQVISEVMGDDVSHGLQTFLTGYDNFEPVLNDEDAIMKNYNLLSCFKKDMHEVMTYLKVICRRSTEFSCPSEGK